MTSITKLIVNALRTRYPESGYDVYTESIEQGFTEPCFSILQIGGDAQQYPGNRMLDNQRFDVRYFPTDGTRKREECRTVADELTFLLRALPGVRGVGMEWEITDDVLHFFVSYPRFVREIVDKPVMETLETDIVTGE